MYCAFNRNKIKQSAINLRIEYLVDKPVHYKMLKHTLKTLKMISAKKEDGK